MRMFLSQSKQKQKKKKISLADNIDKTPPDGMLLKPADSFVNYQYSSPNLGNVILS
jgi:hypothetical protein